MKTSSHAAATAIAAALAIGATSPVAARTAEDAARDLPQELLQLLRQHPDAAIEVAVRRIRSYSLDGVVTAEAASRADRIAIAERRAQVLTVFLRTDLNGDGEVGATEYAEAISLMDARARADADIFRIGADEDRDGTVTFAEASAQATRSAGPRTGRERDSWDLMILDLDEDGRLGIEEAADALRAIAALDPPPVGVPPDRRRGDRSCTVPRPTDQERIVVLKGYEGGALSTMRVGGETSETTIAKIIVEPGEEPLWIYAVSHDPVIWSLEGAIERIERFVVRPAGPRDEPAAGVVGVDASRVVFLDPGSCMSWYSDTDQARAREALRDLIEAIGRPLQHLVSEYRVWDVSIPSGRTPERRDAPLSELRFETAMGRFTVTRDGVRSLDGAASAAIREVPGIDRLAAEVVRRYPGGIVSLAADDIHSPRPAMPYEVLYGQAGMIQLLEAEMLTALRGNSYRINAEIPHLPAGQITANFVLGEGVPLPGGSLGGLIVYEEKTRACLNPPHC